MFGPPVPGSVDLEQGIVTYDDGLRVDLEAVRLFLLQPTGTRLIRPDGTGVEWLGRSGDVLVFRDIPAQGRAAP